ncbi:MAG: RidA family protein, partial [Myxococcota bacterium]
MNYQVDELAQPLANYPHAKRVGDLIFVSGVSSRRHDNTHRGVTTSGGGHTELDIAEQARGVLENIDRILQEADASIGDVVDVTVFLVDMDDYGEFNDVYNEYFDAETGPTRTTVAVAQLPHP